MNKLQFLDRISKEKPDLGEYEIETEYLTDASYIIGCYFENEKWKIYKTQERSGHYIIDELADENDAFDELYELVKIQEKYVKNRNK